jgi:hypothetical protein
MDEVPGTKTLRLRYDGSCAGCGQRLHAGVRAHYLKASKQVRCLDCGPGATTPDPAKGTPPQVAPTGALQTEANVEPTGGVTELLQGPLQHEARCSDCGRPLPPGDEVVHDVSFAMVICLECVTLDTSHTLGTAGGGARREHARRLGRHQTKVRSQHPRLGGLILTLADDPQHVRAWQTGAVGEEAFGARLSEASSPELMVLHDRRIPGSSANIDHLAVTPDAVWVLDTKRYKGKVETRGHGLLSRRPPELYIAGRNQTKLVEGVTRQIGIVRSRLAPLVTELGLDGPPPVRGALVFVHTEFGLFARPFTIDDVWVGWGKAIRKQLTEHRGGPLPVATIAKYLARELRAA